jgi:hypothetical protein
MVRRASESAREPGDFVLDEAELDHLNVPVVRGHLPLGLGLRGRQTNRQLLEKDLQEGLVAARSASADILDISDDRLRTLPRTRVQHSWLLRLLELQWRQSDLHRLGGMP